MSDIVGEVAKLISIHGEQVFTFKCAVIARSQHVENIERHVRVQTFASDASELAELGDETQYVPGLQGGVRQSDHACVRDSRIANAHGNGGWLGGK